MSLRKVAAIHIELPFMGGEMCRGFEISTVFEATLSRHGAKGGRVVVDVGLGSWNVKAVRKTEGGRNREIRR